MKTGVVFLNMGGPDSISAVRPFLYNLFSDRNIIRLGPSFLQRPIAWWIAMRRAPKSEVAYGLIGGRSPLADITEAQARAVQSALTLEGLDVVCRAGMRYWTPRTSDVLKEMKDAGVSDVLGVSLYPHYSRATSGSSLGDFSAKASGLGLAAHAVKSFPDYPPYIEALSECIKEGLAAVFEARVGEALKDPPPDFALVYSAHSLPKRMVDEGDPYVQDLGRTIKALEEKTGIRGEMSFQSRSGPVAWLEPATAALLSRLPDQGKKRVLVVPISFVSDHIETLYEIDMLYAGMMIEKGARLFRTPSLNDRPGFIKALCGLVRTGLKEAGWQG
ncbi:MAG: ferrochelatase [Desulfobacteraceae bacterium]|nr:ferrochelatase [Desulfobacteraceae bacterium]